MRQREKGLFKTTILDQMANLMLKHKTCYYALLYNNIKKGTKEFW